MAEQKVMPIEPFVLYDCSLARRAIGRSCANLSELADTVRTVTDGVLEHHMMRCALDDHFELNEFPNDLARWCWEGLNDNALGEQLGLIDPYAASSFAEVRTRLIEAIEARLWGLDRVPWSRPGQELHLIESQLIAFDTGERYSTPTALAESLPRWSLRSVFYHVHEARRRGSGQRRDDLSNWLEAYGADAALVTDLSSIDFYFLNLSQLRQAFVEAFSRYAREPQEREHHELVGSV
jgi:hypothetical protein